nr:hypothetical protein CFP56_60582 [Quercus suber]
MESDEKIPTDIKCEGKNIDLDAQLDEVAELPPPKKAKTELKVYKRMRTSTIWCYFEIILTKDEGNRTCKCKKCGKEYIDVRADVTENLNHHLDWACPRKFDVPLSILVSTMADTELAQSQLEAITEDKMSMNIKNNEHKEGVGSSIEPSISSNPAS